MKLKGISREFQEPRTWVKYKMEQRKIYNFEEKQGTHKQFYRNKENKGLACDQIFIKKARVCRCMIAKIYIKTENFRTEKFRKNNFGKKLSDAFSGISDKKTFGQTRNQRTSMIPKYMLKLMVILS